jgi:hypothetical protein
MMAVVSTWFWILKLPRAWERLFCRGVLFHDIGFLGFLLIFNTPSHFMELHNPLSLIFGREFGGVFLAKDHRFKYVSIAPVLDWSCHDTEAKNADVRLLRAVLMRRLIMKVELVRRYQ